MRVDLVDWGQIKGQTGGGPSGANIPMPQGVRPSSEGSAAVDIENRQKRAAIEQQTSQKWEAIFQGLGKTVTGWNKQADALALKKLEGHAANAILKFRMAAPKQFSELTDEEMKPDNIIKLLPERVNDFLEKFEKSEEVAPILESREVRDLWNAGREQVVNSFVSMALPAWQTEFTNREKAADTNWKEKYQNAVQNARLSQIFKKSSPEDQEKLKAYTSAENLDNTEELFQASEMVLDDYEKYLVVSGKSPAVVDQYLIRAKKEAEHTYLALLDTFPTNSLDKVMPKELTLWLDEFPNADIANVSAVFNKLIGEKKKSKQKEILALIRQSEEGPNSLAKMKHLATYPMDYDEFQKAELAKEHFYLKDMTPTVFSNWQRTFRGVLRKRKTAIAKASKEEKAEIKAVMEQHILDSQSEDSKTRLSLTEENMVWNTHSETWEKLTELEQERYRNVFTYSAIVHDILAPLKRINPENIQSLNKIQATLDQLKPTSEIAQDAQKWEAKNRRTIKIAPHLLNAVREGKGLNRKHNPIFKKLYDYAAAELTEFRNDLKSGPVDAITSRMDAPYILPVHIDRPDTYGNIVKNARTIQKVQEKLGFPPAEQKFLPESFVKKHSEAIATHIGIKKNDGTYSGLVQDPAKLYEYITKLQDVFVGGINVEPEDVHLGTKLWKHFVAENIPPNVYAAWKINDNNAKKGNGVIPLSQGANLDAKLTLGLSMSEEDLKTNLDGLLANNPIILGQGDNKVAIASADALNTFLMGAIRTDVRNPNSFIWNTLKLLTRKDFSVMVPEAIFTEASLKESGDPAPTPYDQMLYETQQEIYETLTGLDYFNTAPSWLEQALMDTTSPLLPVVGGEEPIYTNYMMTGLVGSVARHIANTPEGEWDVSSIAKVLAEHAHQMMQDQVVVPTSEHTAINIPVSVFPTYSRNIHSVRDLAWAFNQHKLALIKNGGFAGFGKDPSGSGLNFATMKILKEGKMGRDWFIAPVRGPDDTILYKFFITAESEQGFPSSFIIKDPKSGGPGKESLPFEINLDDILDIAQDKDLLIETRKTISEMQSTELLGFLGLGLNTARLIELLQKPLAPRTGLKPEDISIPIKPLLPTPSGEFEDKTLSVSPHRPDLSIKRADVEEMLLRKTEEYYKDKAEKAGDYEEQREANLTNRIRKRMWEQVMEGSPDTFKSHTELDKYFKKRLKEINEELTAPIIDIHKGGILDALLKGFGLGPLSSKRIKMSGSGGQWRIGETEPFKSVPDNQSDDEMPFERQVQVQAENLTDEVQKAIEIGLVKAEDIQALAGEVTTAASTFLKDISSSISLQILGGTESSPTSGEMSDAVKAVLARQRRRDQNARLTKPFSEISGQGHVPSREELEDAALQEILSKEPKSEPVKPKPDLKESTVAVGIAAKESTFNNLVEAAKKDQPTKAHPMKLLRITNPKRGGKPIEKQLATIAKQLKFPSVSEMIQYHIRTASNTQEEALWEELFSDLRSGSSQYIGDLKKLPIEFYMNTSETP